MSFGERGSIAMSNHYERKHHYEIVHGKNFYKTMKEIQEEKNMEEVKKEVTYITKDSGQRLEFKSGMQRDIQTDKPRFDLLMALDDTYENCLLTRWAKLLARGAEKYSERNWEKANSLEEFKRFKSSAYRHFVQLMMGETDEDHFAAVLFNLNGMVYLMNKLDIDILGNPIKYEVNPDPNLVSPYTETNE